MIRVLGFFPFLFPPLFSLLAFYIIFQTQDPDELGHFHNYPMPLLASLSSSSPSLLDLPTMKWSYPSCMAPLIQPLLLLLLMLNLLIAMTGGTHWGVVHEQDELWRAQVRKLFSYVTPCCELWRVCWNRQTACQSWKEQSWVIDKWGMFSWEEGRTKFLRAKVGLDEKYM